MLPASELAAMQATAQTAMDLAVTIKRPTLTADGAGGATAALGTIANTVCNVAKPSAALLQQYAARVGNQRSYVVRLPASVNVLDNDQLVLTGMTLTVMAVLTSRSYNVATQVLASVVV